MEAVKSVVFRIEASPRLLSLLDMFRDMVNEAIWVGFEKRPKSRFQLITLVYGHFKTRYGLHTHYILNACECAFAMLRNRGWRKRPYAKRLFLKLDNQTYQLSYMLLRIPIKPREFLLIPLRGGVYQLSFLRDQTLKRGSLTLTAHMASIAFSKEPAVMSPLRSVEYDINEKNLVASDGEFYDMSNVARLSQQYSRITAAISKATYKDSRTRRELLSKYGERKRNRVKQALNVISKLVAVKSKESCAGIVLEKLTHIRKAHRKGSGEGRRLRRRLNNGWPFRLLQHQIEYKAKWEGIPVVYVRAANTSKTCSMCGYVNRALKYEREWTCPNCGATLHRDLNAARNILSRFHEAAAVQRSNERTLGEGMVQFAAVTR